MNGKSVEGRVIGPYRTTGELGHGGMGVVYRAVHEESGSVVALKSVRAPVPWMLDGIRGEIRALRRINHPGVVRMLEFGSQGGLPWYAMDLLLGPTLNEYRREAWSAFRSLAPPDVTLGDTTTPTIAAAENDGGGVDVEGRRRRRELVQSFAGPARPPAAAGQLNRVIRVFSRLSETLSFLHGEGFVDGDLTPDNVVLVNDMPVIIDLGLAVPHPGTSGREARTGPQRPAGTVPYMSPEQIQREFVDARSDLYSMGCMLYELIVGKPPFVGPAARIKEQHVSKRPVAPSGLVDGVPDELDRLILKLLEKDMARRYAYADEVAAALRALSSEPKGAPQGPRSRSYLYRPRFVGRGDTVRELRRLADRVTTGAGSIALLDGASGLGKTRIAMELMRAVAPRLRVIAGDLSAVMVPSGAAMGPPPLHLARPLLQAVADHCLHGGTDVTARLLGDRLAVLAMYDPSLAQVPGAGAAATMVEPLTPEASRRRLFKYLAETLGAFAREQPLLWVLDDLSWADELSLSFLLSLTTETLEQLPALILCTYRTEEQSDAIVQLARAPHVASFSLAPLDPGAIRRMAADMLAVSEPPPALGRFLDARANGNPFVVSEYLRAAVRERVLVRGEGDRSWAMAELGPTRLPASVRELLEHRLRALGPSARHVALATAVLGREAASEIVLEVAGVQSEGGYAAIDELVRESVVEEPAPGALRFTHDKLREATYANSSDAQRRDMHGLAAAVLEARMAQVADGSGHWATIGHHFSIAGLATPAARYLGLGADHARSTFATFEAIRLYGEAIAQARIAIAAAEPGPREPWRVWLAEKQEKLGDALTVASQPDRARVAYTATLATDPDMPNATRARLLRKVGKTWELQHQHADALAYYARARDALGAPPPPTEAQAEGAEWIQAHIDEMRVHYWLGNVESMERSVLLLEPLVNRYAAPLQRSNFLQLRALFTCRRDRYLVSEETMRYARGAVEACTEMGVFTDLPAPFTYAFALLLQGSIEPAVRELSSLHTFADKVGDTALKTRCLVYLALGARMRGLIEETRLYNERALAVALSLKMLEYEGAAYANEAWLAVRGGDVAQGAAAAQRALAIWKERAFPFQWTALVPLLEASLTQDDLSTAIDCARSLLLPTQQSLPGLVADSLARGLRCWSAEDLTSTRAALARAVEQLDGSGHR